MSRFATVSKAWIDNAMTILSERIVQCETSRLCSYNQLIKIAVARTLMYRTIPTIPVLRKWAQGDYPDLSDQICGVAIKRLMYVSGYEERALSRFPVENGLTFPFTLSASLDEAQVKWIHKNILDLDDGFEIPVEEPYMLPDPPDERYDLRIGEEYVSSTLMRVIPTCVALSADGRKEKSVICISVTDPNEHWTIPIHRWVDQFKLVSSLYIQVTLNEGIKTKCAIIDTDWDKGLLLTRIPLSTFGYAMESDDAWVSIAINILDNDRVTGFSYTLCEVHGDYETFMINAISDGIRYSITNIRITDVA